jgi:hypothetical protein
MAPTRHNRRVAFQAARGAVLAAAGGRCWVVGCTRPATTVDHVLPVVLGGSDHPANLRAACVFHNCRDGARLGNQLRRGAQGTSRRW